MPLRDTNVLIAGAGPTGLMLAGELALAGVDVVIVERRASQDLVGSRAGGLHSRTIETLDQRGIADRFLSQGQVHHATSAFGAPLDFSTLPTRHNYLLALWQNHIERILAERASELEVPIYRGYEVRGFTEDEAGVDIELSDGKSLRADYLVGCDGGRSLIRKTAGIVFPGWDPTTSWLIAEVDFAEEPEWGFRSDARGTHAIGKLEEGKRARVVLTEQQVGSSNDPTLRDVSEALIAAYGRDFGIRNPTWISRFTDMTRQATAYRKGRIMLAGDAAHIHPPMGGQGLNIGVQDAVNLGWKLAQIVKRISAESLLDTYHSERHPVAKRVLRNTMAEVALRRQDDRTKALGEVVSELLSLDGPHERLAAELSGLGVHYDLGEGHPLLGHRMPDLDLVTPDGPTRLFTLLHKVRPVLLNLGEPRSLDMTPWSDRVQMVDVKSEDIWHLPLLGAIAAPRGVLIRPDGYIAWAGDQGFLGLTDALTTWFGPPNAA